MNVVQRCVQLVGDSPTYMRDRANLLTGFTIGVTALLLNGVVLLFVFPFLATPSNSSVADYIDFGQLMGILLLGGASAFATVLIPLRLATVFWEPRLGRYFDQVVLSGITPLRYVIGKAMSQNLFLGLILFLLIPYFVLSLTLGGVNFSFFLAGLLLVWLYCMSLALATLWISLYANDLVAALIVIAIAAAIAFSGCNPWTLQYAVLTPFPALFQPLYHAIPNLPNAAVPQSFLQVFASCAIGMSVFSLVSLFAIGLGPLFGIISENSTFGEVVRVGDSKRKRWFRARMHIQRSSEISFFYANRSEWFSRYEALIRWGLGFGLLAALSVVAAGKLVLEMAKVGPNWNPPQGYALVFHALVLTIHGVGILLAVIAFSHSKNTTYLRLPLWRNRFIEVAKLDTFAFSLFMICSAAASIVVPRQFERFVAIPNGISVFPIGISFPQGGGGILDFYLISWEGTAIISIMGIVIYAFQRTACLGAWMKTSLALTVFFLYYVLIVLIPFVAGVMVFEIEDLRRSAFLTYWAPVVMSTSPMTALALVFHGELGSRFPNEMTTIPFYVLHAVLLLLILKRFRRVKKKLLQTYLPVPPRENVHG